MLEASGGGESESESEDEEDEEDDEELLESSELLSSSVNSTISCFEREVLAATSVHSTAKMDVFEAGVLSSRFLFFDTDVPASL